MTEGVAIAARVAGALAEPFTSVGSRTWWPFLVSAALVAVGIEAARRHKTWRETLRAGLGIHLWRGPSAALDVQLLVTRQLLTLLGLIPRVGSAWAIATLMVRALDALVGRPSLGAPPALLLHVGYTIGLFVAWDASRYVLHRAMHAVPALWQFHQVHHSAEVLTPLTFHRVHPVEAALYELRGALVTGLVAGSAYWLWRGEAVAATVLGVDAIGFVASGLVGNLRHSHVWLRFGRLERWILSPAQHQLHHGADRAENGCNYGVWLACWDRLAGSLRLAGDAPPRRLGLPPGVANHGQDLASALVGPLLAVGRSLRRPARAGSLPAAVALVALVEPGAARAEEDAPPSEAGEEIVVSADKGPGAAGAAYEVDQETLDRYEHDDIHRVLARVPGVYVRGEDGVGLRPNIGMRGASSDRSARITLLEDGVPLAPAPYAAPAAYYFPLVTRLVGVEVFKGPSSIAYGPQTIGGAVNLLTRRVPDAPDGELDAAMGSWSTVKAHGWGGLGGSRGGVLLEGAHLSSGGFKELDGGGPTGFERQDLLAKGRLVLDGQARHVFELKLGVGRERSYETYLGLSLNDFAETPYRRYAASQGDEMRWEHTQESLSWEVAAGTWFTLRAVAYHAWLDRSWTKLNGFQGGPSLHDLLTSEEAGQAATYVSILRGEEDSATADQALLVGTNARTFHNAGVQAVARAWADGDRVDNLAELGVRVHGDAVRRRHTESPERMYSGVMVPTGEEAEVALDSETGARALSAWLRDRLFLGPVELVPGARVEHVRTEAEDLLAGTTQAETRTWLLPGAAVSVEPTGWLQTFAGVHRGISPVPPGEPEDALAETAWNAEAGVRLYPGATAAELIGFGSAYANLSGQCTLSAGCADNDLDRQFSGGQAWVAGVESALSQELELPAGLLLEGMCTYTWTWSSFATDFVSDFPQWGTVTEGDRLPYVPEHQGAMELVLTAPRASLGGTATWRSAMRDVASQGPIPDRELIPASFVLDVEGRARLSPRVEAYAIVRNATNAVSVESLRPYGARPGAPRAILAGVKVGSAE